jgi:predicted MFS family arabinose efflux permease
MTQRSEWAANWPLLLAALIGIPVPVAMSSLLGQFMAPLEQEFGWTRAEASIGYSISLVLGFIASPLVGRLVDKTNARWLALPGIVLTALSIAAFSLATSSIGLWIALWCSVSLVGSLVGPTVWLTVISSAFEKNRSLAISVTLCGMSFATMLAPISGRLAIDAFGWRTAWLVLSVIWTMPALILALLFFHDRRPAGRPAAEKPSGPAAKVPLRHVFLSATFIRLALAATAIGMIGSSFIFHIAPALVDKGMDATAAAAIAGVVGLAAIVGKLSLGAIFDRAGQDAVMIGVTGTYALAAIILAQNSVSAPLAILGCILLGLAGGGFMVALACVATRLFDGSIFGVIYGTLMSLSSLAAACGPLLVSFIHDAVGSYAPAFWTGTVVALLSSLLLIRLTPVSLEQSRA